MIVNEIVVYGVLFALLPEVIRVGTVYNRFSQSSIFLSAWGK